MVSPKSSQNHTFFCHINSFLVNHSTILNRAFFVLFLVYIEMLPNNNNSEKRKQMPSWTGITMRVKSFCWMPYFQSLNVYHFQNYFLSLLLSIFLSVSLYFCFTLWFERFWRTLLTYLSTTHQHMLHWLKQNDFDSLMIENENYEPKMMMSTRTQNNKMEWYGMTWYGIMVFISFCCKFSNYNQIDETMVFFIKILWLELSLFNYVISFHRIVNLINTQIQTIIHSWYWNYFMIFSRLI